MPSRLSAISRRPEEGRPLAEHKALLFPEGFGGYQALDKHLDLHRACEKQEAQNKKPKWGEGAEEGLTLSAICRGPQEGRPLAEHKALLPKARRPSGD